MDVRAEGHVDPVDHPSGGKGKIFGGLSVIFQNIKTVCKNWLKADLLRVKLFQQWKDLKDVPSERLDSGKFVIERIERVQENSVDESQWQLGLIYDDRVLWTDATVEHCLGIFWLD